MNRTNTQIQRREHMVKIGLDPTHLSDWRKKWKGLKQTSIKRGSEFELTFEEYVTIAVESGLTHYSQVGRRLGEHGMARVGDTGPYKYGNCRFLTTTENIAERSVNGGTAKQAKAMSRRFKCVGPNGEIVEGENLTKFVRDMGFAQDSLQKTCRGDQKHAYGWKCEYLDGEIE